MRTLEIAKEEDEQEDANAEAQAAEALPQDQVLQKAKKDGKREEFAWVWKVNTITTSPAVPLFCVRLRLNMC